MDATFMIADALDDAARAIHERLTRSMDQLPPSQREALRREFLDITAAAIRLRTDGVGQVLDDTEVSAAALTALTARARDEIRTIGDVRKAIGIATALFGLAAAVATAVAAPNPASIVAAARSLKAVIDAASTEPEMAAQ